MWTYWYADGIDGGFATHVTAYPPTRASVESAILSNGALIAITLQKKNTRIGTLLVNGGESILLVDGYDPKGPLVIFQQKEIQMTWSQWSVQVRGAWGVTVSTVLPATTTTTTTSPTTTTTPLGGVPADDTGPRMRLSDLRISHQLI